MRRSSSDLTQRPALGRLSDWEHRLGAYLASAETRPHQYGRHDCLLFCAGAVKALTGKDFGRGHRGKYRSAASASRYLRKLGFADAEAMIDSLLPEKQVLKAGRGDIVLIDRSDVSGAQAISGGDRAANISIEGEGQVPGVCVGGLVLLVGAEIDGDGKERPGFVKVPRSPAWVKAWSVV